MTVNMLRADGTIKQRKEISNILSSFAGTLSSDDARAFGVSVGALGDFNDDGFADALV